jgi:hypothetical protein
MKNFFLNAFFVFKFLNGVQRSHYFLKTDWFHKNRANGSFKKEKSFWIYSVSFLENDFFVHFYFKRNFESTKRKYSCLF